MRKATFATLLTLLTVALVLPLQAQERQAQERERHQSYISYDDGGSIVRSGEDGKEIEGQRNLPIYPGDELITGRRGRAEVHLSDGNILGIDRATALRFRSILDSYEGDAKETVTELRYGKVAVQRTDIGRDFVRLDTDNASYVASREAIYSVETDTRGRDRVVVFEGSIEVRTPNRTSRLRAGESGSVDDRGVSDLVGDQRTAADDFERWFLTRAEKHGSYTSRYMDRRLSYWNDDLDDHGRWVFLTGIGWSWRPYVAVGWRPYYNGYWDRRYGCLTWVSHDPWGWGTYHYGRWAYDPGYGWVWVPGYGYSPAWVYWWHGSNYIGWAPSGWWDCHRGYYDWAYRPYRHTGVNIGFGFYGRVRVSDMDLRPWTFIDSNTIASTRVDRAALTTDAIKQRLGRGGNGGFATISGGPARMVNDKLRDPAEEIRRRGLGNDNGIVPGTPSDLTGFFRRDPTVSATIRDRIVRSRGSAPSLPSGSTPSRTVGGGVAPIGGGNVAPIGGGPVAPIGRGGLAPVGGSSPAPVSGGGINRDNGDSRPPVRVIGGGEGRDRDTSSDRDSGDSRTPTTWRNRRPADPGREAVDRPSTGTPQEPSTATPAPARSGDNSWRRRVREDDKPSTTAPAPSGSNDSTSRSSDVPRRVIDRIVPRDGSSSGSSTKDKDRGSSTRDSGSRDRGSRDSGGSSAGSRDSGSSSRSSSPPPPPPPSNNDSGNRGSGGSIKRDQ